jgi:spermidine synthase
MKVLVVDTMRTPQSHKKYFLIALCGSGFSALIFEVLWTKHLSLTFGSTIWAVGIVVATFMGGLALGGAIFGRIADRARNPLRLYALLELGIAVSAVLFRPALRGVEYFYVALHGQFSLGQTTATLFLLSCSALLLVPPTLCMGGTLPVVGSLLKRTEFSKEISLLYAVNVIGAAAGAFIAGYLLIPFWGLAYTEALAYGINFAIATVFWWLGGRQTLDVAETEPSPNSQPTARAAQTILVATFLAGGCALALQLLWNRVLVLFLGSSTYAFSSILCTYLISMAIGGAAFAPLQKRFGRPNGLFAGLAGLSGLYVLATLPFYDQIPYVLLSINHATDQNWWLYVVSVLPILFFVVGPPAFFSGAMFPAAMASCSPDLEQGGRRVGLVVLFNTLGAMVGSLAGAFLIVPLFGLQGGIKLISAILLVLGGGLLASRRNEISVASRFWAGGGAVVALVLLCVPFRWDPMLMNSGIYYYFASDSDPAKAFQDWRGRVRLLTTIEGADATVTVREDAGRGVRYFTVNGKVDGGVGDMGTQILLGQLPVLIHHNPQDLLVIGLGTGVTLGTITQYPARKIDCVEISPAIVKASEYFEDVNLNPRADARVTTHIQDARNFLLLHPGKYDVITSEPSNPWQVGNANLFTVEFFQLVRDHLNPGGIFCQWVPLYELSQENLKVLLRTYTDIFPDVHLFLNGSDLLVIGSVEGTVINYQGIKSRFFHYFQSHLSAAESPSELLARYYLFSGKAVAEFARGADLNSDLFPILEYSSRYNLSSEFLRTKRAQQNRMDLLDVVAREKQTLPLTGLGSSPEEQEYSIREILESFQRENRGPMSVQ